MCTDAEERERSVARKIDLHGFDDWRVHIDMHELRVWRELGNSPDEGDGAVRCELEDSVDVGRGAAVDTGDRVLKGARTAGVQGQIGRVEAERAVARGRGLTE